MNPHELTLPTGPEATALDAVLRPLLVQAGQAALRLAGQGKPERKADGSPVTVADRAAERILAEGLAAAFPQDGIQGEEGARRASSSGRVWVIDPIDGTDAFTHGLAYWGPTVARLEQGRATAGALLLPRTGDYWFADTLAGDELAAWHNGLRLPPLPDRPPPPRRYALRAQPPTPRRNCLLARKVPLPGVHRRPPCPGRQRWRTRGPGWPLSGLGYRGRNGLDTGCRRDRARPSTGWPGRGAPTRRRTSAGPAHPSSSRQPAH